MKKIIIIALLCLGIQGYSQKTVYVFNFTSFNVQIGEIQTRSTATSTYPRFKTNYSGTGGLINVPAGTTYTLVNPNNTYFPFYSPTSVPVITAWTRQFSAGATWANFLSTNLNNVLAVPQVFNFIKLQVGSNGSLGGGYLFVDPIYPNPISGNGWSATYESVPGTNETIITIY